MERKDMALEFKWQLEDIYPDDAAIEAEFVKLDELCTVYASLKGTLGESAEALLRALTCCFDASLLLERLYCYAMMRKDEDNRAPAYQALHDRAQGAMVRLDEAGSFMTPELLSLPEGTIARFQQEEPKLGIYARFLSEIERQREHILDETSERLLAMGGEVFSAPSSIFTMINNADMKYDPIKDEKDVTVEVTHGSYALLLENFDRRVRKDAFESMFSAYKRQENTIGTTYAASVKADVFFSRARKYESSLNAALQPGEVPQDVYDNLLATVEGSAPAMQRYLDLRKKKLDIDEIHFYDLYVPIARGWDMKLPYAEAVDVVKAGLAPLGEKYMADLAAAFDSRWIDVNETTGKTSGAYSCGVYGVHPFVLLNYQENLDNIFTIAHEMGHAMHSFYSSKTQPFPLSQYVIFVAEVASTVNELLLLAHLTKTAPDKNAKAALLNHKLESIRGTVYRQTLFAAFEKESHRMAEAGEPLTNSALSAAYKDQHERYYPGLVIDELLPLEWMRIPHFYRAFYVYQYATGFSAATALSRAILEGKPGALENYLRFLSSGGSKAPLDLLRDAGVDMTSPDPVKACMREFEEALAELEGLL
jgi:oligoendopeptidase F